MFLKVGPVSNRTIPIKSGYTSLSVLNLLFCPKKPRVDCYSECCFSCFLSITYENSSLSFLFFMPGIERIATNKGVNKGSMEGVLGPCFDIGH